MLLLVETLGYKMEGCGFESRWGHWDFFFFFAGLVSASKRK